METKVPQGRVKGTGGSGRISQRVYEYVTLAREHDRGSLCHQPCLQRCWPLMTTPPSYRASSPPWLTVSIVDRIAASMVGYAGSKIRSASREQSEIDAGGTCTVQSSGAVNENREMRTLKLASH